MKYSNRHGTGITKQRESKKAWLSRRLAENEHLAYLQTTPDEELSDEDVEEKRRKAGWKVWTGQELREFMGM